MTLDRAGSECAAEDSDRRRSWMLMLTAAARSERAKSCVGYTGGMGVKSYLRKTNVKKHAGVRDVPLYVCFTEANSRSRYNCTTCKLLKNNHERRTTTYLLGISRQPQTCQTHMHTTQLASHTPSTNKTHDTGQICYNKKTNVY